MVSINIQTCEDCPYVDHSGAFTPGGAQDICDAPDVIAAVKREHPLLKGNEVFNWKYRVIRNKRKDGSLMIPKWCPLR